MRQGKQVIRLTRQRLSLSSDDVLIGCLQLFHYASLGAWFPFLNVYLQETGLSGLQIGTLAAVSPAVTILSQPLWGVLADTWGRRRTLLLTMFLSGLVVLGFGWRGGFWFFLGWTVVRVLLSNPLGPLVDSLTLDHLEERPSLSYGHFRMWGAVGWTVVAYTMGYVITDRDMRLIFVAASVLMFLAAGTVLRTPSDLGGAGSVGSSWRDAGILLRNRRLVVFLVLVMFVSMGIMPIFTFYPIYMNELGASRQMLGLASSLLGLSELPLFFFAGTVVKRVGYGRAMGIACFFFAARAILYSFISQPVWAMAVQVLHAPFSLYLMASIEYINQQVPKVWRATGQSLFWMVRLGAGGIMGNALAGFLYDRLEIQAIFRLLGFLILVVAVAMVVVLREKPAGGRPSARAGDGT